MSADGRLDLDDLGDVIEHASSLDEVSSGAADARPTLGERFASTGFPGWIHRHRVPIAGVTVAVVALGALLWVRRDTRPPDDGLAHVAVLDSNAQGGIETPSPGMLSTIYTLVRQRPGDTVEILGISGPGIRATGVGRSVTDAADDTHTSWPVLATLGCQDPAALDASEDRYHLLVRRTDAYGRTVEVQAPLPLGSQVRWGITVGGACLQTLAATGLTVESVRATPVLSPPQVRLDLALRNSFDRDVMIDVLDYSGGMSTRPATTNVTVPAGGSAVLHVVETIVDCRSPRLDGVIVSPDGQSGFGVTDRTLDAYIRIATGSPDASASTISLQWSAAASRPVSAAFRAACAGLPDSTTRVVSAVPAPAEAQAAALQRYGDSSWRLVRSVVEVRGDVTAVTVSDLITPADLSSGAIPTIVVIDAATGSTLGADGTPVRTDAVGGVARTTVDWGVQCTGSYMPPTARLQLVRGSRTWPIFLSFDDAALGREVLRLCPELTLTDLQNNGWTSLQPPASG